MPKKLKDHYNSQCALLIAQKLQAVQKKFPADEFVNDVRRQIRGKEFLQRQDVFVNSLHGFLGPNYAKNIRLFQKILGPKLKQDTGMFTYGYWLWPIGRYVETYSASHPEHMELTIRFIYELTQRFTGEFAIRPLLRDHPHKVLPILQDWSQDKSVHVRRLASEGIRVRLPWTKKLDIFHTHFAQCFKILHYLRSAPEKFVQKSVGNNINDLYKDRPDLAQKIIDQWVTSQNLHTQWIIRHGQRSLCKKT
jgi:3-methyladenine DNA glycosylase AlkC